MNDTAIRRDARDPAWEQLLDSIDTGMHHPESTCWDIYRYLQAHHSTLNSVLTRHLLLAYIKLSEREPSLINSCMLGMALKVSELHADFQLPNFLKAWGYGKNLRDEDLSRQTGKDGRQYLSLKERVERALQKYQLRHAEARAGGCDAIVPMYAMAVYDKTQNGRRHRFVKMVSAKGGALIADSHQFPCRPSEIVGRVYDVLTRVSGRGNERAVEIVPSAKAMCETFPVEVGYIDYVDESHGHLHVYDAQSRHYVADKALLKGTAAGLVQPMDKGRFVRFCPVVVSGDPFKRAVIIEAVSCEAGCEAFGLYDARISYVNVSEGYVRYALQSEPRPTPEGSVEREGFASLSAMAEAMRAQVAVGQRVSLLLFLKRGKDGVKRNHVAAMF